jgi:[ribosomal protein S5]-alanine N-acetyltransferase
VRGSRRLRVFLRSAVPADGPEFVDLMRVSRALHRPWSTPPTKLDQFAALVDRSRADDFDLQLVCLRDGGAIAGYFTLSQIFRRAFQSAYLGYDGSAPYAGRGYMSEGLALVLRHAFRVQRLHRVEANIQPGNARSRALVERAGFRLEGYSPRYLKIGGRWRDHERWALTIEDWRSRPRLR